MTPENVIERRSRFLGPPTDQDERRHYPDFSVGIPIPETKENFSVLDGLITIHGEPVRERLEEEIYSGRLKRLFVYGPAGIGKSTVLQQIMAAVAHEVRPHEFSYGGFVFKHALEYGPYPTWTRSVWKKSSRRIFPEFMEECNTIETGGSGRHLFGLSFPGVDKLDKGVSTLRRVIKWLQATPYSENQALLLSVIPDPGNQESAIDIREGTEQLKEAGRLGEIENYLYSKKIIVHGHEELPPWERIEKIYHAIATTGRSEHIRDTNGYLFQEASRWFRNLLIDTTRLGHEQATPPAEFYFRLWELTTKSRQPALHSLYNRIKTVDWPRYFLPAAYIGYDLHERNLLGNNALVVYNPHITDNFVHWHLEYLEKRGDVPLS